MQTNNNSSRILACRICNCHFGDRHRYGCSCWLTTSVAYSSSRIRRTCDWNEVGDGDSRNVIIATRKRPNYWFSIFAETDGTGPIDATGTIIVGMSDWEQQITVQCVDPFDVTTVVPDGSSEVVRIEVTVLHNGEETTRLTWIAPR